MSKKTSLIGIIAVIVIIIATVASISIIQSNTIGDVERISIEKTGTNEIDFSFREVPSAQGYYIYASEHGKNEFKKCLDIEESSRKNKCTVDELKQATEYDFYATAYKMNGKKPVESKNFEVVTASTTPSKQIVKLSSPEEYKMNVKWEKNERATGYELQYVKGEAKDDEAFAEAETEKIEKNSQITKTIKKLEANEIYSVRVRSYLNYNDDVLYGQWSQIKIVQISDKVEMPNDIDPNKPMVALTFDDGPGYNSASDKIVDVLEKYSARATFFMLGSNAADHPKNLKRKVELGCQIGNHTYNHSHYGKNVTASDISKASKAIKKACGVAPTAFRSPGGITNSAIRKECKEEGMPLYYWSLDTQDWKYRDADKIYKTVMKSVEDGDIILMHEIYDSTAEAVEKIVPALIKKGYQLVTCDELIEAKTGKRAVAGTQYVNATTIKNETA